jgi:hypothetical protein
MMKIFQFTIFLGAALAVMSGPLSAQSGKGAFVPAKPEDLLKILPKRSEGWKLTSSTGKVSFGSWVMTRGQRIFERVPVEGKDPPAELTTLTVTIKDTGRYGESLSMFEEFELDGEDVDGFKSLKIQSYPAYLIDIGEGEQMLTIMVNTRFLVEFKTKGMPTDELAPWLKAFNFAALAGMSDGTVTTLPAKISLGTIDEMNPERSRVYEVETPDAVDDDE